jgi:hypothetical protein
MLFTQAAKLEPRFCSGDYRPFLATPKLRFPCSFVTIFVWNCSIMHITKWQTFYSTKWQTFCYDIATIKYKRRVGHHKCLTGSFFNRA